MHLSHSLLWTSLQMLIVHSVEARQSKEQRKVQGSEQTGLSRFMTRWPLFKRFAADAICQDDIYISIIRANTKGPAYCASQLDNPRSVETIYVTPTVTTTSITSASTYVETKVVRATKTLTIASTTANPIRAKRAPQPTEKAVYRRLDQVQKVKAAKAFINKVMDGTTIPANPYETEMSSSLSSACNCVYPDAAFTDTVTETDSPETRTIGAFLVKVSTTTSTTIVRTITITSSAPPSLIPSGYTSGSDKTTADPPRSSVDGIMASSADPKTYTASSSRVNDGGEINVPPAYAAPTPRSNVTSYGFDTGAPVPPGYYNKPYAPLLSSAIADRTLQPSSYNITSTSASSSASTVSSSNGSTTYSSVIVPSDPGVYYNHPSIPSVTSSQSGLSSGTLLPPSNVSSSWTTSTSCNSTLHGADPTESPTASYDGTLIIRNSSSSTTTITISTYLGNSSAVMSSATTCTTTDYPVSSAWDGYIVTPTTRTRSAHVLSSVFPNPYGNNTWLMPTASPSFHHRSDSDYPLSTTNCTTTSSVTSSWDGWLSNTTSTARSLVTAPPSYYSYNSSSMSNTTTSYLNLTSTSGCSLTVTLPAITITLPASTVTSISTVTVTNSINMRTDASNGTLPGTQTDQAMATTTSSSTTTISTTSTTTADVSVATNTAVVARRLAGETATQAQIDAACRLVGNQLYNGEFELRNLQNEALGWDFDTDDVNTFFVDVPDNLQLTNGGAYLGRFVGSEAGASGLITQPLTLCPGTKYALTASVRQARILGQCIATFAINGTNLGIVSPGTSWTSSLNGAATFNAGTQMTDANVEMEIRVTCNGDVDSNGLLTLDLDDLSLTSVI